MHTREALLPDAERIHELICSYSPDGTLLPRSLAEICENVRDFIVVEEKGRVLACAALHFYGLSLAEVRSVTVDRSAQGRSVGTKLVQGMIEESRAHRIDRLFLFTRTPEFFAKLGFVAVPNHILPEKVHKDCVACPRREHCDETAMVWGEEEAALAVMSVDANPLRVLSAE